MAIIKFGPLIIGARGTVAGTILSANKSGPYARAWSKGANQRSEKQTQARAVFSNNAQAWADLTPLQRTAWGLFAALPAQQRTNSLGEAYYVSGFCWFVKINCQLELFDKPQRNDPPVQNRPTIPVFNYLSTQTGDVVRSHIHNPFLAFDPDFDALLKIAPARSPGVASQTTHYLIILADDTQPGEWWYFQDEFEAVYGAIKIGTTWFAAVQRQTTDGLISPAKILNHTCTQ